MEPPDVRSKTLKRENPSTAAGEFVHEEIEHVREGNTERDLPYRPSPLVEARLVGLAFPTVTQER
jgi:hypothetical protein